ncbi:uncharacterized protein LOC106638105 isoform X2 [Copidosoma floridanum]|uniref:uncharacterized protein LOC106638105 isoform X2 n=1 Tax=Copidosoma floridanum TaxID=29053 RepID=UPI000C6FC5B5|nr:uncharacterized protein LOC106638105 isoform X2 [Copidosoma floridanum]
MQQPQSRPLLGDSVSSTTSPNTRRNNNPVAVLTQQQLQQLQQFHSQNSGSQVTFTLQQPSGGNQDQTNGSSAGNHILYVNQLNQLNQGPLNTSGTGMGLQSAGPTLGVGLNMGLPFSLLNSAGLTSSNAITASNPLLNLSISNINSGLLNSSINQLNALGATNLNSSMSSDGMSNGLPNLQQDLTGMNRLSALNSANIGSGLPNIGSAGLASVNPTLTSLNQNLASIGANLNATNSGASTLNNLSPNINLSASNMNSTLNQQGLNRPLNTITSFNSTSSSAHFPFQTIQSIQSIAPHIVGSSIANVVSSAISQNQSNNVTSIAHSTNAGSSIVSSTFTSTHSGPILATATNASHGANNNQQIQFGIMNSNVQNVITSQVGTNDSASNSSIGVGFQRQFTNQNLNQSPGVNQVTNSIIPNIKTVQGIQSQSSSAPGSPFSIPMKSPASNIAHPTPSPSPNRILLRSPAPNSVSRNSPSPQSIPTSNANFSVQLQSPMQSPIGVNQIQSPVPSPYPPSKSPHINSGASLANKSPAPGGSPGPPVVRPNTPILQQGMQVLQIIGTPQGYQQTPQLVTRSIFGNQQIQIATTKPNKQPPQILPKPPLQQASVTQPKQRAATTITNQVTQQSQPQIVLAGPQQNQPTATMIPTAQGLLLNQVLPSTGPVIVQQQPGGVQLILRAPTNAQQQTHTAQLTQQQLVRVVTAQGMQLQGLAPTFFAVPNGFSSPAPPVIRHTSSPAPANPSNNGSIVIQNPMVQNSQPQIAQQHPTINTTGNVQNAQTIIDQSLLPPPKKKAKKKKKTKKKDEEPPKMDLASIMKISGIGDDDDIFDSDITESEAPVSQPAIQAELAPTQGSPIVTIPNTSVQQNVIQVPVAPTVVQPPSSSADSLTSSNLVSQVQSSTDQNPISGPISGQLRLSVGEDGRIVLHHTPDPNQPQIDQATAQALIKSLTQGGGQNSQIISQLLQAQIQQSTQNMTNNNRQKFVKSPVSKTISTGLPLASPSSSNSIMSPQQSQVSSNLSNQSNFSAPSVSPNPQQTMLTTTVQASNVQPIVNASSQNLVQPVKNVTKKAFEAIKKQTIVDVKSTTCQKTNVQNPRPITVNQIAAVAPQQVTNNQQIKCNQPKVSRNTSLNQQQNSNKQKPVQICAPVQRNTQVVKNNQIPLQQINAQDEGPFVQNATIFQQNLAQQVSQTAQVQNLQNIFEQNLQQNVGIALQRTSVDGIKIESLNAVQQSNLQQAQQPNVSLLQQNINTTNIQPTEQNFQFHNSDLTHQQKVQANASHPAHQKVQNVNASSMNNQQLQNLRASILISNPARQQEQPKVETQNVCNVNSQAATILNSLKITPEILNNLSNLNPNDQILIATNNGQMQLISQQYLQHLLLTGQLNVQSQTQPQSQVQNSVPAQAQVQQNQTQKIVIGDPDSNNPNLQEVQINTPTSQIIVNSSGGAPTIQNNIQNIVVQAAPNQLPQQIQIQNSGFPRQFIDNLNQQQIRNLGNSAPTLVNSDLNSNAANAAATAVATANQQCSAAKKPKVVKRTKVLTVPTQQQQEQVKVAGVSRPVVTTSLIATTTMTTTTTTTSTLQPQQQQVVKQGLLKSKTVNLLTRVIDGNKNESSHPVANGPVTSLSSSCQVPILSTGQVVQRVQTIQLDAQKQQLLASNQAQIKVIMARKNKSQADEATLQKLYQEQTRILASGKLISSTQHPITSEPESAISVNVVSSTTLTSGTTAQTTCKSQTSTVQTQTPAPAPTSSVAMKSQNINLSTSSSSNIFVPSIAVQRIQSPSLSVPIKSQQQHQQHQKQQQQAQQPSQQPQQVPIQASSQSQVQIKVEGGQVLVPSSSSLQNYDSARTMLEPQQSVQTKLTDIKPCIEATTRSPSIKQELVSSAQLQVQCTPPAGQATSPRTTGGKTLPALQSKLSSPENQPTSPRHGVKRPSSTSPVCRQFNKAEPFEQQLKMDQNGATNPDVNMPFQSKRDACKRLVRYHCFNDQVLSKKDLEKADEIFEETAKHLLGKFNSMVNKYTYLLIMDSMRETRTSELMMIDRMIVNEEQVTLNRLKEQDAKLAAEELRLKPKIEPTDMEGDERLLVPKVESGITDPSAAAAASVKLEVEMEVKSADYDEWLEIQKELGVYTPSELALGGKSRSKSSRARANGETRDTSALELERDLLDDSESLDGLALYAQATCSTRAQSNEHSANPEEHDDITAQVQSAIDSILNLKKRPAPGSSGGQSSGSESNDKLLDQAVRSILGS